MIRVHLKGHFAPTRHAARTGASSRRRVTTVDGRIINTSSGAGLMGSVGQGAYSAAKAGIAALTLVEAAELGRYGVTANAIAPAARTRMTEAVFADTMADARRAASTPWHPSQHLAARRVARQRGVGATSPDASSRSRAASIGVADGWQHGPRRDKGDRWDPAEIGPVVRELLAEVREPDPVYGALKHAHYRRSTIMAMPWPPPTHIVSRP